LFVESGLGWFTPSGAWPTIGEMKLEEVELGRIDFDDRRFRISRPSRLDNLLQSISEIGLINPPVVTRKSGCFVIVSGWKRVEACRRLSFFSLPCHVLGECTDLQAFQIAIQDNSTTRELSVSERAEILKRLKGFGVTEDSLVITYLPLLGIPRTRIHLDAYLAISELEPESKEFIEERKVSFPVLMHLIALDRLGREQVLPLLRHLGQNKQRELLEYLLEISRRDSVPVPSLLSSEETRPVIQSAALSPLQKADKVRMILKKKRYPALSAKKESFESSLKRIGWPEDTALDPPPFFEGEEFTVKFTFKDSGEFREKVDKLRSLDEKGRISELLNALSDD